jgi:hypothetical protein
MGKIGEVIRIRGAPIFERDALVIDDCFRVTNERCTMLVRLADTLEEVEIDINDILPSNSED